MVHEQRLRVALALTLFASLFATASAQAINPPVTARNDDPAPGACDANCSLREAVIAARTTFPRTTRS